MAKNSVSLAKLKILLLLRQDITPITKTSETRKYLHHVFSVFSGKLYKGMFSICF